MMSWRSSFQRAALCASVLTVAVAVACSSGTSGVTPGGGGTNDAGADSAPATVTPDDASLLVPDTSVAPPPPDDAGQAPPPDDASQPVNLAPPPTLLAVTPTQAIVGTAGPTIDCTGSGFVARSVVQVNGVALTTSFVSATELRATVPNSDMTSVGTLQVTVGTAPPGGGGSSEVAFQVVNPVPTITALKPTSALLGAASTPLTVLGSSFVPGATIAFNGTTLPTTVTDPKTATATIPASALATSGLYPVTVTNPAPGGGTSSSIAFIVSNPTVTVTTVTPSTLPIDGPAATIALVGSGFVAASAVSFNGTPLATTFGSATQLSAVVPASSLLNVGAFPVAVTNPAPGGGVSAPVTVSVVYPAVTATSLSPASITLGAPPPTVVVTGSGFLAGATSIAFDGVAALTTVTDGSHASASLTTAQVASAHTFQVTVKNPAPGGGTSAPLSFSVNDPSPAVTSLSPSSVLVGAGDTTVTLKGSGFVPASSVLAGATSLATTYVNPATLTALFPAAILAAPASLAIVVSNPAPGGGTSAPLTFAVNDPVPTATAVSPSFALVGAPDTSITVTGSGFVGSSTVLLGGGATPLATTYVNATTLGATIPASALTAAASLGVSVTTPAPGGGTSATLGFVVDNPGPVITAIAPSTTTVPAAATPITVTGTGFVSGVSVVQIGGTPVATSYGAGTLGATIPASLLATASTLSITVANPAPGGGTSNVSFFTATDPAPVLTSVSPSSIYALSPATPITLTGSGFINASVVQVNGASVTVTARTATSLTATVPAAMLAAPTTLSVTVTNPAPGGGTSAPATITVACDVSAATVVLSALSTPTTLSLSFTGAPTAYRITTSQVNDSCPSADDTSAKEPYLGYVVVNATAKSATLSAWAVCGTTDDGFLAFYKGSSVPTTQSGLEACTGYVAEGSFGAGGHASPASGSSDYCPGLVKANGDGMTIPACGTAVVVIQPYSTTGASYTPPTSLTIELQ